MQDNYHSSDDMDRTIHVYDKPQWNRCKWWVLITVAYIFPTFYHDMYVVERPLSLRPYLLRSFTDSGRRQGLVRAWRHYDNFMPHDNLSLEHSNIVALVYIFV